MSYTWLIVVENEHTAQSANPAGSMPDGEYRVGNGVAPGCIHIHFKRQ